MIGRVVVGSSRGRIGTTIVGTGFDGSFVPCAEAAPKKLETQKLMVKNSIDARICFALNQRSTRSVALSSSGRPATREPAPEK
jgi:hypothetical protein